MIAQKVEAVFNFLCYFIGMKMKKILLFLFQKIFLLASVAMLLSLYILRYFTKRKMGMARYMVYFRDKWSGRELGAFSLLQWSVLLTLFLFSLLLSFIVIRLFRKSYGRSIGKKAGKTSFPFMPIAYSFFLLLYSFLYFFSFVGDPGREYTASLLVHVLLQFFSTLFLATYLRKGYQDEK